MGDIAHFYMGGDSPRSNSATRTKPSHHRPAMYPAARSPGNPAAIIKAYSALKITRATRPPRDTLPAAFPAGGGTRPTPARPAERSPMAAPFGIRHHRLLTSQGLAEIPGTTDLQGEAVNHQVAINGGRELAKYPDLKAGQYQAQAEFNRDLEANNPETYDQSLGGAYS